MYTQLYTNKCNEHEANNNKHEKKACMENAHIQTVAKDFSRRREFELYISRTSVRLNLLDYKRAEQSDQIMQL